MANEWPANDSTSWDTAISNNLTTGGSHNASTGLHGLGVLSAFKTVVAVNALDVSTVSTNDTTAVTGVGFTPRQVVLFTATQGTSMGSWGVDDGTLAKSSHQDSSGDVRAAATSSVVNLDGASNIIGKITSLDADGFTLTWTVTGTPTGTMTTTALCLK